MNDMSEPLHYLQITELAPLIERREVSPLEVTRAQLSRIAELDNSFKSYAVVTPDAALAQAKAAEADIAAGSYLGPLHGVPIGVKDLFWTKDAPTAGGMTVHRDFRPTRDATVVERLRRAGAIILGKLQMTEEPILITIRRSPRLETHGTRTTGPASPPAARPWRQRPASAMGRSVPTPAVRSAGPAGRTDSPASSPHGAGSAAMGCSSLRAAWIMSARLAGAWRTLRQSWP
jgi:Asp-tRNA(Asn)/Glu-tRNA(Gln) amidotransferase A subunit family amidase